MKTLFLFIMIVGTLTFAHANNPGFSQGSEFQVIHLSGDLTIYCPGENPTYRRVNCSEDYLFPTDFDYFVGPQIIGATTVKLSNPAATKRVQKSNYNSTTGKSKSEFNLWIRTLLQQPLLEMGANTISYVLLNDEKKILKSGNFQVNVNEGQSRVCPDGQTISNWPSDCEFSSYPQGCAGYFREYNYCQ